MSPSQAFSRATNQIERAAEQILAAGVRRVGFWSLAFKPGTDDLRESPLVTLAEILGGKGIELKIHDEFVQVTRLVGGNKAFIEQTLPHLAKLLVKTRDDLRECELIVLGHPAEPAIREGWRSAGQHLHKLTGRHPHELNPHASTT